MESWVQKLIAPLFFLKNKNYGAHSLPIIPMKHCKSVIRNKQKAEEFEYDDLILLSSNYVWHDWC